MPCSISLSRQEAARIWAKRDAEWEKERQARERLMKEVLAERQSQIEHKMDMLKSQQVRTCLWVWVGRPNVWNLLEQTAIDMYS